MIRRLLARLLGVRVRLLLIVTFVALLATIGATGANYVDARRTVLAAAQDQAMRKLRDDVDALAPAIPMPPDQAALDELVRSVSGAAGAFYGNVVSRYGRPGSIPAELRAAVHAGSEMRFQRVVSNGWPALWVGMPVLTVDASFNRHPSGLEVYAWYDLNQPSAQIQAFTVNGWRTAAVAVPIAVLVAWLAASAVLRPVRRLRDAARRLAEGELSVRLPARGNDELAELVRTFNHAAARLEVSVGELRRMEADARRFVADVSHELRTPLAAMTAVNEVLDDAALAGDTGTAARLVSSETRKLARLVEDLIEISRFDSGAARLDRRPTDLAELVSASLRARGFTGQVETGLPAGIIAEVDPRRIDVVVANLVGNALRHGEPPVFVRLSEAGGLAVLTVVDHGPGLPENVLPHVFSRFYKADAARTRSEGSGLGLSIALKNAELHGGRLDAGNEPGAGARFVLTLPKTAAKTGEP
ncbi:HAMP domain-containing histidine kinase [Amycolatopsis rhizosphaerae]|uniref:histidine kinase n=1 Tax=Amycolatopsis rhizosphaerae TaxID=2053003 RepID=A0A558CZQ8_9PSEU|nr:HAMP domain-containing sensor histidine kinase [Amycolatopsis rhizosphaerae]TVT54213.1 HAMP domain-containing histidine kinase [Amycolatopsis rhizosphaerae]